MTKERDYPKLEKSISAFKRTLEKAADTVLEQGVSSYPVCVLHRQDVPIGIPLKKEMGSDEDWLVNLSTVEELSTKQVIDVSRVKHFTKIYKNPQEFLCLFIIDEFGANFVFLPRN
jgi:CBS domain containing-hemolysin-like protein